MEAKSQSTELLASSHFMEFCLNPGKNVPFLDTDNSNLKSGVLYGEGQHGLLVLSDYWSGSNQS